MNYVNLSLYQNQIISLIKDENLIIVTSEGENYKCWLENGVGDKIKTIDKRTVNVLSNLNKIKQIEDNSFLDKKPSSRFYWELK